MLCSVEPMRACPKTDKVAIKTNIGRRKKCFIIKNKFAKQVLNNKLVDYTRYQRIKYNILLFLYCLICLCQFRFAAISPSTFAKACLGLNEVQCKHIMAGRYLSIMITAVMILRLSLILTLKSSKYLCGMYHKIPSEPLFVSHKQGYLLSIVLQNQYKLGRSWGHEQRRGGADTISRKPTEHSYN